MADNSNTEIVNLCEFTATGVHELSCQMLKGDGWPGFAPVRQGVHVAIKTHTVDPLSILSVLHFFSSVEFGEEGVRSLFR